MSGSASFVPSPGCCPLKRSLINMELAAYGNHTGKLHGPTLALDKPELLRKIYRPCLHEDPTFERCAAFPNCHTRALPPEYIDNQRSYCGITLLNAITGVGPGIIPATLLPIIPGPLPLPAPHLVPAPFGGAPNYDGLVGAPSPQLTKNHLAQEDPDPHVTALLMHRNRMVELERAFQVHIATMRRPDVDNVLPGPGNNSRLQNLADLISSMHDPISDLNRQYVRQLDELIEFLDSIEEHVPNLLADRPPPPPRPAPAPRPPSPALRYEFIDDQDVPDIPIFPDASLDIARHDNPRPEQPPRSENAQREVSHGFMTRISPLSLSQDSRRCTVCMEDIGSNGEHPVRLDCGHIFGNVCIERWFGENTTCPVCRMDYDYGDEMQGPA